MVFHLAITPAAPRPPRTRSRAATGTTTGGRSSTRPASGTTEPSGDACDHFWRYPDDIAMLADLGFGAYRFSLEWSRIEPEEGEFSRNALDHYRRMIAACRDNDVLPGRHVPSLHDAPLGRGRRRLGQPRDRRPLRPLLRAGRRSTSATRSGWAARSTSRTSCRCIGYRLVRVPARHQRPRRVRPGERELQGRAPEVATT